MDIRRVMRFVVTLAVLAWYGGGMAEDFSDAERYGNKTANLARLNKSCADPINIGEVAYAVKVPDFSGIAHAQVHSFLQEKIKINEQWDALCAPCRDGASEILENKKLPDDFLSKAEELGKKIKTVCAKEFEFTEEQRAFITTANEKRCRLMVRSTGKEDTAEMANAGGNTTVINVEPTVEAMRSAVGEVVASYIGRKSLSQRVAVATNEKHINDLFERPFMPVLLQVMIGEPRGGQQLTSFEDVAMLPVPGVMFTTEAEGFTDGLVHIQTTFGHNEGVVNSLVPVDTWYVSKNSTVFPIVRHKHERLVPGAQGLERKKNALQNGEVFSFLPSLAGEQAVALAKAGRVIEGYYTKPMDVEFVLMPAEKTIYLVQARPIVKGEKSPTYFDDDLMRGNAIMRCSKVGVGNAGVAVAESADGIMVYETLAQALDAYLQKNSSSRAAIKCIVVQQAPAATSHEATTFRSFNMPVMQHNNVASVTGWLASQKGQIVVDPQRGVLLATDEQVVSVKGWFESPLPRQLSVGVVDGGAYIEKLKQLLVNRTISKVSFAQLFESLKSPPSKEEAKIWLMGLVNKMHLLLKKVAGGEYLKAFAKKEFKRDLFADFDGTLESKKEYAQAVMMAMLMVANDYLENLENISDNSLARNMQLLYPVLFMQALYNQTRDPQLVGPISLGTLMTGLKRDVRAAGLSSAPVKSVVALDMLKVASDYGFSPEIKERWAEFVSTLSQQTLAALERQMEVLEALGSLPMFVNVIFPSIYTPGNDAEKVLSQIVELMEKKADSFNVLQEIQQKIIAFDVSVFADPAAFTKQWGNFKQELLHYFMSSDFANMFQKLEKNNLVQMTALSVMHKMVDAFDLSIKSLKGSTEYADVQQKVDNVHTMVVAYWNLFEQWVKFLPEDIFPVSELADYWLRSDKRQDVEKYCKIMGYFKEARFEGAKSLEPSFGFNVTLAAIGSSARIDEVLDSSYKQRWTLEDYFTLSHQNLLVTLSYLLKQTIDLSSLLLPEEVKKSMEIFESPFEYSPRDEERMPIRYYDQEDRNPTYTASLVGMLLSADNVEFTYNIPLRGHSASFVLSYDYKHNKVILAGSFYRNLERPSVFQHIATYAKTLDIYTKTHLLSTRITQNATYLVWDVGHADYEKVKDAITRILLLMYPETANIQLPEDHWNAIYALKNSLEDPASRKVILAGLVYYSPYYQKPLEERVVDVALVTPSGFNDVRDVVFDFFGNKLFNKELSLYDMMQEAVDLFDDSFVSYLLSKQDVDTSRILEAARHVADHNILKGLAVFEVLIRHDIGFDDAMSLVEKAIQGNYANAAYNVLRFLVLEKNQNVEKILNIIRNDNYNLKFMYIRLFTLFFKKNIGFKEAIVKAQAISKNENDLFDYKVLDLWVLLFENNQGFTEAIKVAFDLFRDVNDDFGYRFGLNLLEALVEHGHGINEAVSFIEQRFQSTSTAENKKDIYKELLSLLSALVEQGKMLDLATEITRELLQENPLFFEYVDIARRLRFFRLLKTLVSQGQVLELAAQMIRNLIKLGYGNSVIIAREVYELFGLLIKKGYFSNDFSNDIVEVVNTILREAPSLAKQKLLKDALLYERYTDYNKVLDSKKKVYLIILTEFFGAVVSHDPDLLMRKDNLKVMQDLVVTMVINISSFEDETNEQVRTLLGWLLEKGKGAGVIHRLKDKSIPEDLGVFITSITKRVKQESESWLRRWVGF